MRVLVAVATSCLFLGCSPGEALRPSDPTYAAAAGDRAACSPGGSTEPLVVDWTPDLRADLEQGLASHVVVVSYDCHALRLLQDCEVTGDYAYRGVTPKEQVISLSDKDELHANLPTTGPQLAASLGGGRGASLDIALMIAGKVTSSRRRVLRSELAGRCDGATHFVRRATLGAFAMSTGTKGEAKAALTVFQAAAGGSSVSAHDVKNTDGSIDACRKGTPEDRSPLPGCASPLRIELLPIDGSVETSPAGLGVLEVDSPACAAGLVLVDGRCTRRADAGASYQCTAGNKVECTEQCRLGHAGSCANLGAILSPDASALGYFKKACDADNATGCFNLALSYEKGLGIAPDVALAAQLHARACDLGSGPACGNLGALRRAGLGGPMDKAAAARLYERGCDLGAARPCVALGGMFARGEEVAKDAAKAEAYLLRGCDGGDGDGCDRLGAMLAGGEGVPRNERRALELFDRACSIGSGSGCSNAGALLQSDKHGLAADKPRAKRYFDKACGLGDASGCAWVGIMMVAGDGVPRDEEGGVQYLSKGCRMGDAQACDLLKHPR